MIRKADIILAISMIILGLIVSYAFASHNVVGDTVHVTVNGELYGYYSLAEDQTIEIAENDHINKITINDGSVSMMFSDCANQDCVLHREISKSKESIVCLPNKVVVEIKGEESQFDAIAQ